MDNLEKIFCGLCLNTINNQNFEVIEKNKTCMLEVLLPNLTFNQEIKQLMCNECSEKVLAAFEFKLMCINTENTIVSYVDVQKKSPIDLIEIFSKENGDEMLTNKLDNQKLCRLCMNLVTDKFVPFHEIKTDVIHLYIPDVNFNITKDPVICKQCLNSLTIHTSFIKNCKNAEDKIVCNKNNNKTHAALFDPCVESENIEIKLEKNEEGNLMKDNEFETELKEELLKCQGIKIKCEENEENSIQLHFNNSNEALLVNRITENKAFAENFVTVKCESYNYKSRCRSDVEMHISIHKQPPDILQCTSCDYKSDNSQTMDKHMLIHRDPSEIQTCICGLCSDKSKLRPEKRVESEKIVERDSPDANTYACVLCRFQTTRRYAFKMHAWSHKDPSLRPFRCESCDYKAKNQSDLKKHKIRHTDPSKLNMFKCTLCTFQAKVKADLKKHITRRHSEETETYKCYICQFKTKYKYNLRIHVLSHQDPSESLVFQCEVCGHRVKTKRLLQIHKLKHMDPKDLKMFACSCCDYQATYKERLMAHMKKCQSKNLGVMKDIK